MANIEVLNNLFRAMASFDVEEAAQVLGLRLGPINWSELYTRRNLVFLLLARRGMSPGYRASAIQSLLAMPPGGASTSTKVQFSAAHALMALGGNHDLDRAVANHSLPENHRVYLTMVMEQIILYEMTRRA